MKKMIDKNNHIMPIPLNTIILIALVIVGFTISTLIVILIQPMREHEQNRKIIDKIALSISIPFDYVVKNLKDVAEAPNIQKTISGEMAPDNEEILVMLGTIRLITNASLVYLMDSTGLTVASTPYGDNLSESITGKDYSFRPYFIKVKNTGRSFVYGALGVTTGERGLYVSVPVTDSESKTIGVIVAKLPLTTIDEVLHQNKEILVLASAEGVIFATNHQSWLYKTCYPLSETDRKEILESRQFGDQELSPLGVNFSGKRADIKGDIYNISSHPILFEDWHLLLITPHSHFNALLLIQLTPFVIATIFLIGFFIVYFLNKSWYKREQLLQQAKLQESNIRFDQLAKQSRTYTWEVDKTGLFTYVSNTVTSVLGYLPEEIIGKMHFYDMRPKTERESFKRLVVEFFAHKEYFSNLESQGKTKTGKPIWINTNGIPVLDKNGDLIGYKGNDSDITDRKKAETIQADTALRLSLATKAGGVGVWDLDLVSDHLVWDDQMYDLYGISSDTFGGVYESWRVGIHPDDLLRCDMEVKAAINGEKDYDTEFRVIWPDSSLHYIRALAQIQHDKDGKPLRMIGTNWDITAQKSAEAKLKKTNENLEKQRAISQQMMIEARKANAAKSEFLANMSHEIRTPLNGVIGFTELLKNTPLDAVQQQYVDNANVSGHVLLGIINDILDFSKIEAGMLNLEIIKADMVELLENSADIIQFAAGKKGLEVLLNIDQSMPRFAYVDPVRLKQILANLLGNAVKFTKKGEVELKVSFQILDNGQGKFSFFVRDTGIGISDAQKQKAIQGFFTG